MATAIILCQVGQEEEALLGGSFASHVCGGRAAGLPHWSFRRRWRYSIGQSTTGGGKSRLAGKNVGDVLLFAHLLRDTGPGSQAKRSTGESVARMAPLPAQRSEASRLAAGAGRGSCVAHLFSRPGTQRPGDSHSLGGRRRRWASLISTSHAGSVVASILHVGEDELTTPLELDAATGKRREGQQRDLE